MPVRDQLIAHVPCVDLATSPSFHSRHNPWCTGTSFKPVVTFKTLLKRATPLAWCGLVVPPDIKLVSVNPAEIDRQDSQLKVLLPRHRSLPKMTWEFGSIAQFQTDQVNSKCLCHTRFLLVATGFFALSTSSIVILYGKDLVCGMK
jgi:hypothetical protein